MKTIKSILKELLKKKGNSPAPEPEPPDIDMTETFEDPADDPRPETSHDKPLTETHPNAKEEHNDEENKKNETDNEPNPIKNESNETENPENPEDIEVAAPADSGNNRQNQEYAEEELKLALKAAYDKGFIDGKNAQIEQKFFPASDGIPAFRGAPSKPNPCGDIFSMAREA